MKEFALNRSYAMVYDLETLPDQPFTMRCVSIADQYSGNRRLNMF